SLAPVSSWSTTTSPRFGSCRRYDSLLTNTRSPEWSVGSIDSPSTTKSASRNVRTMIATKRATPTTTTQSMNALAAGGRPERPLADPSPPPLCGSAGRGASGSALVGSKMLVTPRQRYLAKPCRGRRSQRLDQLLDPLVATLERVLAQHRSL